MEASKPPILQPISNSFMSSFIHSLTSMSWGYQFFSDVVLCGRGGAWCRIFFVCYVSVSSAFFWVVVLYWVVSYARAMIDDTTTEIMTPWFHYLTQLIRPYLCVCVCLSVSLSFFSLSLCVWVCVCVNKPKDASVKTSVLSNLHTAVVVEGEAE